MIIASTSSSAFRSLLPTYLTQPKTIDNQTLKSFEDVAEDAYDGAKATAKETKEAAEAAKRATVDGTAERAAAEAMLAAAKQEYDQTRSLGLNGWLEQLLSAMLFEEAAAQAAAAAAAASSAPPDSTASQTSPPADGGAASGAGSGPAGSAASPADPSEAGPSAAPGSRPGSPHGDPAAPVAGENPPTVRHAGTELLLSEDAARAYALAAQAQERIAAVLDRMSGVVAPQGGGSWDANTESTGEPTAPYTPMLSVVRGNSGDRAARAG